ncbi:MAG: serine hydrolase domain-containing protein [Pseudomonadota bacterium]
MKSLLSLALTLALTGCAAMQTGAPLPSNASIDSTARQLMQTQRVNGLALAVIDNGQVVHSAAYGWRNVDKALPLTTASIMYGASLTKTAFAYMMLQLVDEGLLDLDATIDKLLPRPLPSYPDYADLAKDERWKKLTPRILLTHSTGFANFRWLEADKKLRFHFEPGQRYGYSGEGFYLLQLIVESGLGLDAGKEMQRRVFDRFNMPNTSMKWRPDFNANLADGYGIDGKFEPHDERSRVSAAGSMDTSIADQANMWAGIVRGDGLSKASRASLVKAQLPIVATNQFPTLVGKADPRNAEIGLAAGLGLVTFTDKTGPAWFKGGHNDFTGNMVVCLEQRQRCVVMLANDVRAERIYPALVRAILGDTAMPWRWEYGWADTAPR